MRPAIVHVKYHVGAVGTHTLAAAAAAVDAADEHAWTNVVNFVAKVVIARVPDQCDAADAGLRVSLAAADTGACQKWQEDEGHGTVSSQAGEGKASQELCAEGKAVRAEVGVPSISLLTAAALAANLGHWAGALQVESHLSLAALVDAVVGEAAARVAASAGAAVAAAVSAFAGALAAAWSFVVQVDAQTAAGACARGAFDPEGYRQRPGLHSLIQGVYVLVHRCAARDVPATRSPLESDHVPCRQVPP